jgi:hypothetical protein
MAVLVAGAPYAQPRSGTYPRTFSSPISCITSPYNGTCFQDLGNVTAGRTIDAQGMVVETGFIDMPGQSERTSSWR